MMESKKNEITEEERKEKEKVKKSNKKNNKENKESKEKDKESEIEKEIQEEQDDDVVWSVGIEDDGNVHVRPIAKEDIEESEDEITEEEVKAVAEAIIEESKKSKRSIQSIVKELAGVEEVEEKIETPKGFTKKQELNKKEYGYHNGRKYLKLKNGFGMWADNGQSFSIDDLD